MSNTKDTPMDYKKCECGGDIIMFTPDLDICQKCGKQYEPRSAPYLLKENQSLKLELQKQKEEIEQLRAVIEKLLLSAGYALHESLIDEAKKLIYK